MSLSIALDLGTTSTAAVAVDERGQLVGVARQEHHADLRGLPSGHAEQSPQRHLTTALDVLRILSAQLTALTDEPVCLGLTGQMHSLLLLDASQQPVTNLITWQDRRANEPLGDGLTYLEDYLRHCPESALDRSGCRLSPGYAAVSAYVLKRQGRIPPQTARLALLADWVGSQLTAGDIQADRSNAASTGAFDLLNDCWNVEVIDAGGLPRMWFPDIADSGTVIGRLTATVARATGLPPGLPVVLAIGDNQASVLGSVPQGDPAIQITIGTGGQINWPVASFCRVEGLDTRPLPLSRLMLVGAGLAGGDAYAWVNRTVGAWLEAFGFSLGPDAIYDALGRLSQAIPAGASGLSCAPYFRGTRREPLRRGTLTGISTENFSPGHLARAVLEGVANGLHEFWERAGAAQRPQVTRIVGCGHGLEQNPLLVQLISARFGLPLLFPQHVEAAAYGAALVAGVGVGLWSSLDDAGQGISLETIDPPTGADDASPAQTTGAH